MKSTLKTGKKIVSVFMAILMVLTSWVFVAPMKADAADVKAKDKTMSDLHFYVPETIYLAPERDGYSYSLPWHYSFQWYVDSTVTRSGENVTASLRTGENSSGNVYFYYKNTSSVTISYRYLNASFNVMSLSSGTDGNGDYINYVDSSTNLTMAGTAIYPSNVSTSNSKQYTKSGNELSTTITAGRSAKLAVAQEGCFIEWTASYTDSIDGKAKTAYAYTYLYKPRVQPVGCAIRTRNNRGSNSFSQNISWVSGIHTFNTDNGSYVPNSGSGDRGLIPFSSSNNAGVYIGSLYAQFASTTSSSNYFGYTNTSDKACTGWLSKGATTYFSNQSISYKNNETNGSNTGDNAFYTGTYSPVATIAVDTSRYTNMNQIPNLSLGMMVTDHEGTSDGAWYVANYSGSETTPNFSNYEKILRLVQRHQSENGMTEETLFLHWVLIIVEIALPMIRRFSLILSGKKPFQPRLLQEIIM